MSISELIYSINTAADASQTSIPDSERLELIAACKRLQSNLENPMEKTYGFLLAPYTTIGLRLGVDMKLFDRDGASTIEELAAQTNADPLLVTRVLRLLIASGIFTESQSEPIKYTPAPIATSYKTASPFAAAIIHMTQQLIPLASLPEYLQSTNYISPSNAHNGPFQYARKTEMHSFAWLATQPGYQEAFNTVMSFSRDVSGMEWWVYYPLLQNLSLSSSSSSPAVVDIGGGVGHVLIALLKRFPELKGRLVLQDLPHVIERAELPEGIEGVGVDFFEEQPVEGASIYYLRAVLHDWPDAEAVRILGRVRDVMGEGSTVLVNEGVAGRGLMECAMDFVMMSGCASLERTEGQWGALFEKAGLEMVRVWRPEGGDARAGCLFEGRLKR